MTPEEIEAFQKSMATVAEQLQKVNENIERIENGLTYLMEAIDRSSILDTEDLTGDSWEELN